MDFNILDKMIKLFDLNLSNLNIYTEAASNYYIYNPLLALKSGAKKVFAQSKNSIYGKSQDVSKSLYKLAKELNLHKNLEIIQSRDYTLLSESDIITNSGFVRPIDKKLISALKKTAVIPLMWETWEYREEDFDLKECKKKSILVLGTNESQPPCDMKIFMGELAIKLLNNFNYDGSKILLIGRDPSPGGIIYDELKKLNIEVFFVSNTSRGNINYLEFKDFFYKNGANYKYLILADFMSKKILLGKKGIMSFNEIENINPNINLGIIAGDININELTQTKINYFPKIFPQENYKMKFHLSELRIEPVLKLFAGGLKVGQEMAYARKKGLDIEDSKKYAIKNSPAMDFY